MCGGGGGGEGSKRAHVCGACGFDLSVHPNRKSIDTETVYLTLSLYTVCVYI